jgi:hypothetical protein
MDCGAWARWRPKPIGFGAVENGGQTLAKLERHLAQRCAA